MTARNRTGDERLDGVITAAGVVAPVTGPTTGTHTGPTIGTHTGPTTGPTLDSATLVDVVLDHTAGSGSVEVPAGQGWMVDAVVAVVMAEFDDSALLNVGTNADDDGFLDAVDITSSGEIGLIAAERGALLWQDAAAGPPVVQASPILAPVFPGDEIVWEITESPTEGALRLLVFGRRISE